VHLNRIEVVFHSSPVKVHFLLLCGFVCFILNVSVGLDYSFGHLSLFILPKCLCLQLAVYS